jgi:hypothetical protein
MRSFIVAGAAATALLAATSDRMPGRAGPAAAPVAGVPAAERPVRVIYELVTARPAIESRPPSSVRVRARHPSLTRTRRGSVAESRAGLPRWFFGDGVYRPNPFPRPAERQRSTVR